MGDAHTVGGAFAFSIGEPVVGTALPETPRSSDLAGTLLRWLQWLGQGVLLGGMLFRALVWRPALAGLGPQASAAEAAYARGAALLADVVRAALIVGTVGGLFFQARGAGISPLALLGTQWGMAWILRTVLILALSGFMTHLLIADRLPRLGLAATVVLLGTTSMTSHSAATGSSWLVVLDWLHLIATSAWAGGVVVFAAVALPALRGLDEPARRRAFQDLRSGFSLPAAAGVGGTLITGLTLAFAHIGGWPPLLLTEYGLTFQLKAGLVLTAMLLGGANLVARVLSARPARSATIRLGVEALLVLAAFLVTARLAGLPRAASADPIPGDEALSVNAASHMLQVEATVTPARTDGIQQFRLDLHSPDGDELDNAESVDLTFIPVGGGALTSTARAVPDAAGDFVASGRFLTRSGEWQVLIEARLPGGQTAYQTFDLDVGPDGVARAAGSALPVRAALLGWLSVHGASVGTAALVAFGAAWSWLAWLAAPRGSRRAFAGLLLPSVLAIAAAWYAILALWRM